MDKIIIEGQQEDFLESVDISGAKNAVLPIMTAALICRWETEISKVPNLRDTRTMIRLLEIIGAKCSFSEIS